MVRNEGKIKMDKSAQRVVWIDWAKAILIYLMVVGHCFPVAWENQLIYAFHMPAFFIISGYLYHPHHWWKTLKSFLVPIFFFSVVNFVIYAVPKLVKGTFSTINIAARIFLPFWGGNEAIPEDQVIYCFPGVWFIIALLLCRLFMGDIKCFSWVTRYKYYVLGALLLFLTLEPFVIHNNLLLPYKFYRFIPSMPFVLFGYCLRDRLDLSKISYQIVLLMVFAFVGITFLNGYSNILNYQFGYSYSIFFIGACIGSLVLYYLCSKLKKNPIIQVFSMGTMLILAMNFNLKIFLNIIFDKLSLGALATDKYLYPWILGLLIMAICYYPIKWLLNNYPLLLGKVK